MGEQIRPTLGPFMHLTCFQFLRRGAEDYGGRALIVAAGRERGLNVAEELGLMGSTADAATIAGKLREALGPNGTHLCLVESITAKPNGGFQVRIKEGACTANQHASEPFCAFTMGVFIGAINGITGKRVQGREHQCEACGADACVYEIDPVE